MDDLKQKLDPLTFHVTQEKGTETPFTGKYVDETADGMYKCAVCGNVLFTPQAKFVTNINGLRGWPSFEEAIRGSVIFLQDDTLGMSRTEVVCAKCKSHLGHVFDEKTETETGKHFCINSCALNLRKSKMETETGSIDLSKYQQPSMAWAEKSQEEAAMRRLAWYPKTEEDVDLSGWEVPEKKLENSSATSE